MTFKNSADPQVVLHCCCEDSRKSNGTGYCTHIPKSAFAFKGEVTFYAHSADSGNTVSQEVCGTCGSPVYLMNSGYPVAVFHRASVLDHPDVVQPQMVVFANR